MQLCKTYITLPAETGRVSYVVMASNVRPCICIEVWKRHVMSLYITTLQELIKSYYTFIGLCLFIFCVRLTFDPITPSSLHIYVLLVIKYPFVIN